MCPCSVQHIETLLTETEGNSMFRVHKTYCFPEVSVNKYVIIYQESKKRKNEVNFIQKYLKYSNNFLKKLNLIR